MVEAGDKKGKERKGKQTIKEKAKEIKIYFNFVLFFYWRFVFLFFPSLSFTRPTKRYGFKIIPLAAISFSWCKGERGQEKTEEKEARQNQE